MPKGLPAANEVRRWFWRQVRSGVGVPAAAGSVGVFVRTGWLWHVKAGGMPDVELAGLSGR